MKSLHTYWLTGIHSTTRRRHLLRQPGAFRPLAHLAHAQELLAGLTGIHSGKGVVAVNAVHKHLGIRQDAARVDDIETEHPVVCVYPVTGRRLRVHQRRAEPLQGHAEAESKTIIDFLIARAIHPENTCRVRWKQGTLTLWANPFVMHTAINDYASYRRVTYRSTVEGWCRRQDPPKLWSTTPPDRLEHQPGACDRPLRQAGRSDAQ